MTRKRFFIFATLTLALLASVISFTVITRTASADSLAALGTGFTYQGELVDDGQPVDGVCDFQFSLWDDPTGGSQSGATQTKEDVAVVAGRFNVLVNDANQFGSTAFNGDARWLEIGVRCPAGSGTYTVLNQRQPLSATPYAQFAARAAAAPWGGLVGIPAGFADNVDDDTTYSAGAGMDLIGTEINLSDTYRLPQSCSNEQVAAWDGSIWVCRDAAEAGDQYANVIVVAKSGGDYSSIQGALDSIGDAAADNRYLILVAPGVYNERVTMKSYVEIEGAGQELITITASGAEANNEATVTGADDAELRDLTVENSGGDEYAVAIYNSGVSARLTRLTVLAENGSDSSYGIYNTGGSTTQITDVHVTATGTDNARAIYNGASTLTTVKDTEAAISGCATGVCYTIATIGSGASITLDNVTASALADGATAPTAVFGSQDATLFLRDVTAFVTGGTGSNTALNLINASATVRNSILSADDSDGPAYGVYLIGGASPSSQLVNIIHSELYGPSATIQNTHSNVTIDIAGTMLDGGTITNSGGATITCAGVYDEAYTFYASTCP